MLTAFLRPTFRACAALLPLLLLQTPRGAEQKAMHAEARHSLQGSGGLEKSKMILPWRVHPAEICRRVSLI